MKEVVVIIRPHQAEATHRALGSIGIGSYTAVRVLGRSRQGGLRYPKRWFRRSADIRFLPKRMFQVTVEDSQLDEVIAKLVQANSTGRVGDGKIFVLPSGEVIE